MWFIPGLYYYYHPRPSSAKCKEKKASRENYTKDKSAISGKIQKTSEVKTAATNNKKEEAKCPLNQNYRALNEAAQKSLALCTKKWPFKSSGIESPFASSSISSLPLPSLWPSPAQQRRFTPLCSIVSSPPGKTSQTGDISGTKCLLGDEGDGSGLPDNGSSLTQCDDRVDGGTGAQGPRRNERLPRPPWPGSRVHQPTMRVSR